MTVDSMGDRLFEWTFYPWNHAKDHHPVIRLVLGIGGFLWVLPNFFIVLGAFVFFIGLPHLFWKMLSEGA